MLLYYSKGACSLAVRIMLHEMGIEAQFESVDLGSKKTQSGQNFLEINPKGFVPVLVLEGGEILTENTVIQQYLADKYKAFDYLPPANDINRYHVLEWLNFVSTEIHKSCGPLFNSQIPDALKESIFVPALKSKLAFVEKHLSTQSFLMGDKFTSPDAYLFVVLRWMSHFKIDINQWPSLTRYFAEIKKRKSVEQSLKEEGIG